MTDKEAMQMALETAEQIASADYRHWGELASLGEFERWARSRANHIAEALRARLSQCERCGEVNPAEIHTCSPQRGWQGLTDDEAEQIADLHWDDPDMFIQAIEDVLRRKNS
jgi:hypothetical protein